MKLNRETRKWILILVAISLLMIWAMQRLQFIPQFIGQTISFFSPLLIGVFIAFVVNLPMRWIEEKFFSRPWQRQDHLRLKIKRPISMLLACFLVVGVIVLIFFMVLPDLLQTVVSFTDQLRTSIVRLQIWLQELDSGESELFGWLAGSSFSINNLIQRGINWLNNVFNEAASSIWEWVSTLINGFLNTFFGIVFSIYFLLQKEKIAKQFKQVAYAIFPERQVDKALKLGQLVNGVFSGFVSGQGLEALILGGLVFIGMQIFRFPYPLTISVLIVVGALIPIFGAFISGLLGSLLIMVDSPLQALAFIIMLVVIQQIEGNFIYPRVVGKSVGLPALWVLFAVTFGSKLFGFLGLLLGVPAFSVFYVLLRSWSRMQVQKKGVPPEKIENFNVETPVEIFEEDTEDTLVEDAEELLEEPGALAKEQRTYNTEDYAENNVRPVKILFDLEQFEKELTEDNLEAKHIREEAWKRTLDFIKRRKKARSKKNKDL